MPDKKEELENQIAHMIGYEDWGDKTAEDVVEDIFSLIDAQRCVWTLGEDDPTYGKTLQLECDKGKYHPYFLLRLDKYPFCPCCGKRISIKEDKNV